MNQSEISQSRKADAARRQLGTALHLWLADLDPISVHVLTSGGCEIARALAKKIGKPFSAFSLEVHPHMTERELGTLRNMIWNAMKHADHRDGRERDDEELLSAPLENENEARLCEGWYDLMQAMPAPIEAQTLIVWFMAKYGNPEELDQLDELFPNLRSFSSEDQKALLRERIEAVRQMPEIMNDARTDLRPLILPA